MTRCSCLIFQRASHLGHMIEQIRCTGAASEVQFCSRAGVRLLYTKWVPKYAVVHAPALQNPKKHLSKERRTPSPPGYHPPQSRFSRLFIGGGESSLQARLSTHTSRKAPGPVHSSSFPFTAQSLQVPLSCPLCHCTLASHRPCCW